MENVTYKNRIQVTKNVTDKDSQNDFSEQKFYIGIDVHKKSWTVTIITSGIEHRPIVMPPDPDKLYRYMKERYPGGEYYSVYEAGYTGFWIHRELVRHGINNIVVNPADVPTKYNERTKKSDPVDSRKLARELSNGKGLKGIYIPGEQEESIRGLCRHRKQLSKDQARIKCRIKSHLFLTRYELPENCEVKHWSKKFINYLKEIRFIQQEKKKIMDSHIMELEGVRELQAKATKEIRRLLSEDERSKEIIGYLESVPGVGAITAMTLYTELIDIHRFSRFDKLCAYVGFSPATASSGEKERVLGISYQQNVHLRSLLIESAWVAIKKDPAMTRSYGRMLKRMSSQKAIIRIAKKLLNRIMYVWKNSTRYVESVVS
jgi:transposase